MENYEHIRHAMNVICEINAVIVLATVKKEIKKNKKNA